MHREYSQCSVDELLEQISEIVYALAEKRGIQRARSDASEAVESAIQDCIDEL